jgi:hypothetical protein
MNDDDGIMRSRALVDRELRLERGQAFLARDFHGGKRNEKSWREK